MSSREIWQILKGSDKSSLCRWFIGSALLLFVTAGAGLCTVSAYRAGQAEAAQKGQMQEFLTAWQEKASQVNASPVRPVTAEQVADVQRKILFAMQGNGLQLSGMQEHKEEHGKVYEADFSGKWPEIVKFLQNFHADDALLSVKSLTMNSQQGEIQAHFVYKIYQK